VVEEEATQVATVLVRILLVPQRLSRSRSRRLSPDGSTISTPRALEEIATRTLAKMKTLANLSSSTMDQEEAAKSGRRDLQDLLTEKNFHNAS
jgi:hypothetical protein